MGEHVWRMLVDNPTLPMRRKRMPAFNGKALRGYAGMVARMAEAEVAGWPVGKPFRLHERMRALTLEVILQVVFGVTDHDRLSRLRPLVDKVVNVRPIIMIGGFYPRLLRLRPWRTRLEVQRQVDAILYDEMAARR